ncbi:hypothetical protein B0H66DRAFT_638414 [Apodospora peruviana]|uniref:Uncharacterized protein n=1 Tax=Apodospora peruviana TaxID=516989 RepID=A0AAE0IBG8_9PEZI|nr:hypothetical protein B0H66DRAFT_638414 [Apodospora peruviana]
MLPTTPFGPTMRRFAATSMSPSSPAVKVAMAKTAPGMIIPGLVVFGAVYGVVAYVRSQLKQESETMNRMFAQQNSPRVLEARKKNYLIETEGDPRKSVYNILNWSR